MGWLGGQHHGWFDLHLPLHERRSLCQLISSNTTASSQFLLNSRPIFLEMPLRRIISLLAQPPHTEPQNTRSGLDDFNSVTSSRVGASVSASSNRTAIDTDRAATHPPQLSQPVKSAILEHNPTSSSTTTSRRLEVFRALPQTLFALRTGWSGLNLVSAGLNLPISPQKKRREAGFNLHIPATPRHTSPPVSPHNKDLTQSAPRCKPSNLHLRRRRTRSQRDKQRELQRPRLHKSKKHGNCYIQPHLTGPCSHVYRKKPQNIQEPSYFPQPKSSNSYGPAVFKRRWSLMQVRNARHASRSRKTFTCGERESFRDSQDTSRFISEEYRSPYIKDNDLIALVQSTLTARKFHSPSLPDFITLRRASVPYLSGCCAMTRIPPTCVTDPDTRTQGCSDQYLISSEEVNLITNLLQEYLVGTQKPVSPSPTESTIDTQTARTPVVSDSGLLLGMSEPSQTTLSTAEVQPCLESWFAIQRCYDHVPTSVKHSPTLSPSKSLHEVIWEAGSSPECESNRSLEENDADGPVPSPAALDNSDIPLSSQPERAMSAQRDATKSEQHLGSSQSSPAPESDSDQAMSRRGMADHAPAQGPPRDIGAFQDSFSDTCRLIVKVLQTPTPALATAIARNMSVEDVLSFPPLPDRNSMDWQVPLPPLETPPLTTARSLHSMQQDTTNLSRSSRHRFLSTRTSWIRAAEIAARNTAADSIAFDPNYSVAAQRSPTPSPPISIIVSDPSNPSIKRVHTIDHAEKGEREGWNPARPPSLYPATLTPDSCGGGSPLGLSTLASTSSVHKTGKAKADEFQKHKQGQSRCVTPPSPRSPWIERSGFEFQNPVEMQQPNDVISLCGEGLPHNCDDCYCLPRSCRC